MQLFCFAPLGMLGFLLVLSSRVCLFLINPLSYAMPGSQLIYSIFACCDLLIRDNILAFTCKRISCHFKELGHQQQLNIYLSHTLAMLSVSHKKK